MSESLSIQVGGNHYKKMSVQPVEFALVNGLNTCQANIIKYVCRHQDKDGAGDLKKAIHYCDLWLEIGAAGASEEVAVCPSESRFTRWHVPQTKDHRPIDDFVNKNRLPSQVEVVVKLICHLPGPARIKSARAVLVTLLFQHYSEVA